VVLGNQNAPSTVPPASVMVCWRRVSMIVVDVRTPGQIRATASFDASAVEDAAATGRADSGRLLGSGTLAMTVEQGHTQQRYQGYVPLEAKTYAKVSERYEKRVTGSVFSSVEGAADVDALLDGAAR